MKSKIIITFGPACFNLRTLKQVVDAGAEIIRINTKYISIKDYEKIRGKINSAGKVKIMIDIKDRKIINKLLDKKFDYLAVSFAENPSEIVKIRKMFKKKIKIISKIETKKAVDNIDKLIKVSDGIMIARGDLGRAISFEKIPMIQKMITKKCNKKRIMSITATEMMPSMVKYIRPSRAEVTDVANAVLEGSEALLLAEETAIGKNPVLSVKAMKKIIKETEKHKIEFR
jgi:pyruvate kinase